MKCPQCQFDNREEAKFCSECGQKLERACPACGNLIRLGAKFCDDCGHNLTVAKEAPPKDLSFDEKLEKIPTVTGEGFRTKTDPLSQRIKAWSRLFLADSDNDQTQSPYILSTTRRDVVELLFDAYEERCKQQPGIVFSIPFPDLRGMTGNEFVGNRDAFRADARDILDQVQKVLMDTATGVMQCPAGKSEHVDPDWLTTWAETLERHFPSADSNHGRLTVYCLDNTPLADLLTQTLKTVGNDKAVPNRYPTGLIALLNK